MFLISLKFDQEQVQQRTTRRRKAKTVGKSEYLDGVLDLAAYQK